MPRHSDTLESGLSGCSQNLALSTPLQKIIATEYGLPGAQIAVAPRQFVAETYRVTTPEQRTYFCKVVDKPIWIPKIIGSLPVLDALHRAGFERANYPIKTTFGAFHVMVGNTLVALFSFMEGQQTETFDDEAFGYLLGQVHRLTDKINVDVPRERFALKHGDTFEGQFDRLLAASVDDPVLVGLQRVLRNREVEIRRQYAILQRVIAECNQVDFPLVITHGDPGGNVLAKSPTDLFLVDWDEIMLAPAERDIWIHDTRQAFMAGYRRAFPDHQPNPLARRYCIASQHFDYMAYYLADITSNLLVEERTTKLRGFEAYFEGWIKPFLESLQ